MGAPGTLQAWLGWVGLSLAIAVGSFLGLGGLVHDWFYRRRRGEAWRWKLQPERWLSRAQTQHAILLGGANMVLGSLITGTFLWHLGRGGWSMIYSDWRRHGIAWLLLSGPLVLLATDAGLYYSHRLLHHRLLFRHVHRWHHRYVAPIIFTTTAVHPLEFLLFQAIAFVPAFVFPVHVVVFFVALAYTYLIGMIDHVGVRLRCRLPLHDDNCFHDEHHIFFHCNFGHHSSLFDRLHGTVRRSDRHYDEHTYGGHGAPPSPLPRRPHA
jgi:lathosterol oxidase